MRTLGAIALAIQSQSPTLDSSPAPQASDILSIIRHDYAVLAVLFILLMFSAASWGIIIYKQRLFRRATLQSTQFSRSSGRQPLLGECRPCAAVWA